MSFLIAETISNELLLISSDALQYLLSIFSSNVFSYDWSLGTVPEIVCEYRVYHVQKTPEKIESKLTL